MGRLRRTDLVLTSNFVLCKDLDKNRCVLLYCGEPKDELKAFLQLESFIKRNTKRNSLLKSRKESGVSN